MFIDNVSLLLSAGKGGDGIVAWRREKYIPKGGPAGGDGGTGGSIILKSDENVFSLENFRNQKFIRAENGKSGAANNSKGKNGKDLILSLPLGTIIKDKKSGEVLFDLYEKNQIITLCYGGKGGKGNSQFKSPTNQAPSKCTKGKEGQSIEVILELKLIADIGLVGFPNAGKSTLLSNLANINLKIAPYPFTTLTPNLGIIEFDDFSRLLIADIPGIIEGAHRNKGLGFSFLKHIERTSALVYIVDISGMDGRDPIDDFSILQKELKSYNEELVKKPFIVILNKIDSLEAKEMIGKFKKSYPQIPENLLFEISALEDKDFSSLKKGLKRIGQLNGKKFI